MVDFGHNQLSNVYTLCAQSESEDYEQILASLALDIQKRQTRLSEIRLRERRSTLLVTLWALGLWGLYVSFWYTGLLPEFSGYHGRSTIYTSTQFKKTVMGTPVFLGPIVCVACCTFLMHV